MKTQKRLLALVLCCAVLFCLVPCTQASAEITQNEYGEYFIDTFEDLKQLAAGTYESQTNVIFPHTPVTIVLDEDFTIPEHLSVFASFVTFVIPEGVTLTISKHSHLDANLEIAGSVKNYSYLTMRIADADTVVDVSRIDCSEDSSIQLWYSPLKDMQAYRNLLATAEANPQFSYNLCFNNDFPFVISEDLTIPGNVLFGESWGSAELIINEGCTLTNCGLLETSNNIRINGTLVNQGEMHFYSGRRDPKIILGEKGTFTGKGGLFVIGYENVEDAFEGLNLEDYQVSPWEWFSGEPSWQVRYNPNKGVTRLAGSNRFETATLVADRLKETLGVEKFNAVILANGYNFADALAGSYLSSQKQAPILLTWNGAEKYNYLNDATIEYVKNNLNPGGTVYILGGTSAVPASIDSALSGFSIKRMDGANRFETNLMILEEAGVKNGSEILVCTSTNFADSLSASAVGKPILLVFNESGKLYGDQPEFLAKLQNCTFTVIGGENAVSRKLTEAIGAYGAVTRVAGANRFDTSVLVAIKYFAGVDSAVLAYAWDFPDGLCGGGLAYAMDAPLILTMTGYESPATLYIDGWGIRTGVVLGGEGLISAASVDKIFGN